MGSHRWTASSTARPALSSKANGSVAMKRAGAGGQGLSGRDTAAAPGDVCGEDLRACTRRSALRSICCALRSQPAEEAGSLGLGWSGRSLRSRQGVRRPRML